jgi:hypothetical protein
MNGNQNSWGWNFSKNKTAAKELLEWLSEREQANIEGRRRSTSHAIAASF